MMNTVNIQNIIRAKSMAANRQKSQDVKGDKQDQFKDLMAKAAGEEKPEEADTEVKTKEPGKDKETVDGKKDKESKPGETMIPGKVAVEESGRLDDSVLKASQIGELFLAPTDSAAKEVAKGTVTDMTAGGPATDQAAVQLVADMAGEQTTGQVQTGEQMAGFGLKAEENLVGEKAVKDLQVRPEIHLTQVHNEIHSQAKETAGVVDKPQTNQNIVDNSSKVPTTEKHEDGSGNALLKSDAKEQPVEIRTVEKFAAEDVKGQDEKAVTQNLQPEQLEVKALENETVRIKVAEPFNKIDPEAMKGLADKITGSLKEGKQEFLVQLEPENLGKIAVKISMLEAGIKVTLVCENPKTCELLSQRAGGINQIVEQNTGNPTTVEVKEGYWNQQKDATDEHSRQNGGQDRQQQDRQQQDRAKKAETDDFVQQLRLGFYDNRMIV